MSKARGASLGRMKKRGRVDMMGRPMQKRPFNNSKRTRGTAKQETVKQHYLEMMRRLKYIKGVAVRVREAGEELTAENWKTVCRKYDKHQLLYDSYEKQIIFEIAG